MANSEIKLASYNLHDIEIACYLHPLGLDEDCKPNGSITLTAVLRLPQRKRDSDNLRKCTARLTVSVYEGLVKESRLINEPRFTYREMDDDDRQSLVMHLTVHDVVRQEDIVFSRRCPDKIFFKLLTEICFYIVELC